MYCKRYYSKYCKRHYSKYGHLIRFEITCTRDEARILLAKLWPEYANADYLLDEMTDRMNCWRSFYKNGVLYIYRHALSPSQDDKAPLPSNVIKIVEKYLEQLKER